MAVIIGGSNNTILSTTWANKPASYPVGQSIFISNAGAKGSHWFYDGTRWKPVNGRAVLASLDTASSNISNTYTVVFQYLIPAGMWQNNDTLRIGSYMGKSGTTDTGLLAVYCGTAGTTSDALLTSGTYAAAANLSYSAYNEVRLVSDTTAQPNSTNAGIGGTSGAVPSPITISSAASNALYISVGIRSSGSTDTVFMHRSRLELISTPN